ncbi:uncharacterized protein BDV14DRAFT_208862 [Aspergillus stella-maris]|uniref:uncharacterized protein n=1 Tax=Aspergillus stella-maris TaxID=1810926 RepID=UPI003CCDF5D5
MYDITLFGATGYTGSLCATYIAATFPTNTRWCITGRSETRLKTLAKKLGVEYPDRVQPEIEIIPDLERESIDGLIANTKVVINGVGPFHRYSTGIVEACAVLGTSYLDFSTETLWIKELIEKYEDVAKASGAIIILGISPTAPADILAWLIAKRVSEKYETGPTGITATGKLDIKAMSPGSLTTVLDSLETWGPSWYLSGDSRVLSSSNEPDVSRKPKASLASRVLGYRSVSDLGVLTTSFIGPGNASVVHRSATQNPELYGSSFHYEEYIPATGVVSAIFIHFFTKIGIILLSVPLIRGLLRVLVDPNRPIEDQSALQANESAEYRAVGMIRKGMPVVWGQFLRQGPLYEFTALLTCVGARTLLEKIDNDAGKTDRTGGFLTPSSLGMEYVEGLREAGVSIEVDDFEQLAL